MRLSSALTAVLYGSNLSADTRRTFHIHYRSYGELGRGYWQKPPAWIAAPRAVLRQCIRKRRATGFTDADLRAGI